MTKMCHSSNYDFSYARKADSFHLIYILESMRGARVMPLPSNNRNIKE